MANEYAKTEFKSILRLRPILKKEREDPIVLESINELSSVVSLRVLPKENVRTTVIGSPETLVTSCNQSDIDFHFDRVLTPTTNQEKTYLQVGLPVALESMKSLKADADRKSIPKTHLVIGMGNASSGKTFTIIGCQNNLSTRKSEADGLLPRMLDSFFSQSKHNIDTRNSTFAVNISMVQANQSKVSPSDCEMHDLLLPMCGNQSSATFSASKAASKLFSSFDLSNSTSGSSKSSEEINNGRRSDCFLINNHVTSCTSPEMAREILQKAVERSRKLMNKKYQCHFLVKIQPFLVGKSGKENQAGELVAFLDMASYEGARQRSGRLRDSLANRDDAHTSILHCLRAIQYNEKLLNVSSKESSSGERTKAMDLKKIPFLQHKVTILLQPLFSSQHTKLTQVSLLLTLSPSYRDFDEKKDLLNDIESIHRPFILKPVITGTKQKLPKQKPKQKLPKQTDNREIEIEHRKQSVSKENYKHDDKAGKVSDKGSREKHRTISCDENADFVNHEKHDVILCDDNSDSSSYLVAPDELLEPLPPPVAPTYQPAAPCAEVFINTSSSRLRMLSLDTADFPGICLESEISKSNSSKLNPDKVRKEDGCQPVTASAPVEEIDHHGENSHYASLQFFNYLKTINKVVSASKKKGRQVIEKIAVSANQGYNRDTMILELEGRLAKLDKKNNKLLRENQFLREQNMRLIQENMDVKLSSNGSVYGGYMAATSDDDKSEETESVVSHNYSRDIDDRNSSDVHTKKLESVAEDNHSSWHKQSKTEGNTVPYDEGSYCPKAKENHLPWHAQSETEENYAPYDEESYSPKNSLDDPFFKHMAYLNDETSNLWDRKSGTTRKPLATTQSQVRHYCDTKPSTSLDKSGNQYQDPVFAHMANTNPKPSTSPERSGNQYQDPVFAHMEHMNRDW